MSRSTRTLLAVILFVLAGFYRYQPARFWFAQLNDWLLPMSS